MGFFQTFWTWLDAQLALYVQSHTQQVALLLEPVTVTLGVIYVMLWGYLHLTGRIDEPFVFGLRRLLTLAVVLGVGMHLWLYNDVLVNTFYVAPTQLAAALLGAPDPVATIDAIWDQGGKVAGTLWSHTGIGFWIAAAIVWVLVGLLCVYTMFLIALAKVALAVLLALGPLFMVLLLFDGTRRFFESWIAQLANYALVTLLTVLVAALLLQIVKSYADQTAALGSAILTVDVLDMLLATGLVFLFMRQVTPIAAGLAAGVALSSTGALGQLVHAGVRGTRGMARGAVTAAALAWTLDRKRRERAEPGRLTPQMAPSVEG